jgi:hypothetical protein
MEGSACEHFEWRLINNSRRVRLIDADFAEVHYTTL